MALNYKRIGQRIRVMRKARKLTQAELAERADLSVPYISHIENGIKKASLQAVVNIAEALECTAPELAELLSDCTAAEQQFLLEVFDAIKDYIKTNRHVFDSITNQ